MKTHYKPGGTKISVCGLPGSSAGSDKVSEVDCSKCRGTVAFKRAYDEQTRLRLLEDDSGGVSYAVFRVDRYHRRTLIAIEHSYGAALRAVPYKGSCFDEVNDGLKSRICPRATKLWAWGPPSGADFFEIAAMSPRAYED